MADSFWGRGIAFAFQNIKDKLRGYLFGFLFWFSPRRVHIFPSSREHDTPEKPVVFRAFAFIESVGRQSSKKLLGIFLDDRLEIFCSEPSIASSIAGCTSSATKLWADSYPRSKNTAPIRASSASARRGPSLSSRRTILLRGQAAALPQCRFPLPGGAKVCSDTTIAFHSGELAFRSALEPAVEKKCHHLPEYGVAEEFKPLVVAESFAPCCFVEERPVGKG